MPDGPPRLSATWPTVDVCPFRGPGSSDLVLYNGWNTYLVCDENWRA